VINVGAPISRSTAVASCVMAASACPRNRRVDALQAGRAPTLRYRPSNQRITDAARAVVDPTLTLDAMGGPD